MRASQVITSAIGVYLLALAVPAAAQTQTQPATMSTKPAAPALPLVGVHVGVMGGLSAVQNVGGLVGLQVGYEINPRVQIEAEGMWMKDVTTRAKLDAITSFGAYLTAAQGKGSTATLTTPANYVGASIKALIPTSGPVRPYFAIGAGIAKIAQKPVFTIGGADVTTSLGTYGVTLGSDFTGEVTKAALTGGLGAVIDHNRMSFDLGIRVTSIQTDGQKTNVLRAHLGVSYKF